MGVLNSSSMSLLQNDLPPKWTDVVLGRDIRLLWHQDLDSETLARIRVLSSP